MFTFHPHVAAGPLKVEIKNKKQESLNKLPNPGSRELKKLIVVLKITHGKRKEDLLIEKLSCFDVMNYI